MRIDQLFPVKQQLVIKDGAGKDTDVIFELLGQDCRAYRDAQKKGYAAVYGKSGDKDDLAAVDKANAELTASAIGGWSGLENADGPVPYSKEKAFELMSMPELGYVRDQVDAFIAERANFFRKGEKAA